MKSIYSMQDSIKRLEQLLEVVGYLSVAQAKAVNYNSDISYAAIKNLCYAGKAFFTQNKKFILRQPWRKPYLPLVNAVDVLLVFARDIHLNNIYVRPPKEKTYDETGKAVREKGSWNPLLIGFTKGKKIYEIYEAKDRRAFDKLITYLNVEYQRHKALCSEQDSEYEDIRYLILTYSDEMFFYTPKEAAFPYAYARVQKTADGACEVGFYNPEKWDD